MTALLGLKKTNSIVACRRPKAIGKKSTLTHSFIITLRVLPHLHVKKVRFSN